jgi:hypothetical protein
MSKHVEILQRAIGVIVVIDRKTRQWAWRIAGLSLALMLLSGANLIAVADGGGWPTATSTQVRVTAEVTLTPGAAKDAQLQAVEIQAEPPVPEATVKAQPDTALLGEQEAAPTTAPNPTGGSNNLRMAATLGGIVAAVLLAGFLFFRLRR